ncbi:hypothetical protein CONPUDRAFT_82178 [Coniophora puteana RWD-64-598 SS2]|uniref:Uncharacterized protein n=1 Tax=Coniophora puteana (strain RWD-64-598) TaxID=741705 RepID=A0A5M3MPR8_CONPW|nr:uncharacterized protein CONPUDRAFT_82178 [Coniophora puteana RWD-64-598 SS2]EIW81123.1 hypothetical protein CONPUDRAFT_82178 [Coniophora puteana RWD-64-598 SS2]
MNGVELASTPSLVTFGYAAQSALSNPSGARSEKYNTEDTSRPSNPSGTLPAPAFLAHTSSQFARSPIVTPSSGPSAPPAPPTSRRFSRLAACHLPTCGAIRPGISERNDVTRVPSSTASDSAWRHSL